MAQPYVPDDELRERPLSELLGRLARDVGTLVRQEADLARAEVRDKAKQAAPAAGMFGAAAFLGLMAAGALTAFLVLVLALVMPAWVAALIVAVVLGAVAGVLALRGRARLKEAMPPVPEQTVETVKEDVQWAKNQKRSVQR
jgi:MFS family permease